MAQWAGRTGGETGDVVSVIAACYELVGALYFGQGMSRGAIARELSMELVTVESCIERYRRTYRAVREK